MLRRALTVLTLSACSYSSFSSGDLGVTPGGSQDITYARELIAAGRVPDQEHFTAEGLFSEHDLPLEGPACEAVLCPRTQATVHRPYIGDPKVLVQFGFGTSMTEAEFKRPDLDLVFLVDISGSMSGAPLDLSIDAMLAALDQLGPADRAGLVVYGNQARVVREAAFVDDKHKEKLRSAIAGLGTNGSTDMESGMRKAYAQFDLDLDLSHRLMIFSDAQPNTGLTAESDFLSLVRENAAKDIGLTFFGVSPQVGSELADVLSKVRGGNSFFLTHGKIADLFGDEFDFLVTPVAYDMQARMVGLEGAPIGDEVYGAPVDGEGVQLGAATLFFSSRNGGMAATFDVAPSEPVTLGEAEVSWVPVGGVDRVTERATVRWDGGRFSGEADGLGVAKIDALVHMYKAMNAAAQACDGAIPYPDAADQVDAAGALLAERSATLEQPDLDIEVALLAKLAENLRTEGGVNCAPADYYEY